MSCHYWSQIVVRGWLVLVILLTGCSELSRVGIGPTPTPEPPLFRYDTAIVTAEAGSDTLIQAAAYLARGDAHAGQGDYEAAISDYTSAIARDSNDARAYNNRALANQALEQFDTALADLDAAIRIDPSYVRAYKNRVALLEQTEGDPHRLADDYGRLAELEPAGAAGYRYRQGSALHGLRDLAGARTAYDAALAADPQHVDALYERALLSYAEGRPAEALADLDRAITLSPRAANAYYARGLALNAIQDVPGALDDFTQALALDSNYAEAWLARAALRSAAGDTAGATSDLDHLEQLSLPEDLQAAVAALRRSITQ
jgi:tetratricopeptide (TPR) repeat protein